MCGIYGYIGNAEVSLLKNKQALINYRGPDYSGSYITENIFLGHNRLSIIDLDTRSNQPFYYEHLIIVFNGEIYNFDVVKKELLSKSYKFTTGSDTEVICAAYLEYGFECLSLFNGMFSFVIYDKKSNILFGARDRLGKKPFYYKTGLKSFEFCSQLSPIANGSNSNYNWENVEEYFFWGYNQGEKTVYENIFELLPGHYFIYQLNSHSFKEEPYWNIDLSKSGTSSLSFDESVDFLDHLITDAVKIRKIADVPVGIFLSGGIDSSLVSAIAQKNSNVNIKTFSISFFESEYDESKYAKQVANYIKSNHDTFPCTKSEVQNFIINISDHLDEPLSDPSYIPTLLLSKKTAREVTVALSGDGGDEMFLGYERYKWIKSVEKIFKIPYLLRKPISAITKLSSNYRHQLIGNGLGQKDVFDLYCKMVGNMKDQWIDFSYKYSDTGIYWNDHLSLVNRVGYFDMMTYLNGDINTKVDRASMRFSLETRAPLMDYRIAEFANSLPESFKYTKQSQKKVLKKVLYKYLPESYFNRPKAGFAMPLKEWFRSDLKEFVLDTLTKKALKKIPFINVAAFEKMIDMHMKGESNNSLEIWKAIVWLQLYEKY